MPDSFGIVNRKMVMLYIKEQVATRLPPAHREGTAPSQSEAPIEVSPLFTENSFWLALLFAKGCFAPTVNQEI
jgi:hypothetical protein